MLEITNLSKTYITPKGPFTVLADFNLSIKDGEMVSLIGHSGCGKSTVLNMIAGLLPKTSGSIMVDKIEVTKPGVDRAMVFQSPSLFPWMTALENVMLGVRNVQTDKYKFEQKDHCIANLESVGLGDVIHQKASDMSQGMRQRVGIARALALEPALLLLDEPFGMLDSLTRAELQGVLLKALSKKNTPAIMVTHDVDEAVLLSDRVVMMTSGPFAKIGKDLSVNLERPRDAEQLKEDPRFYAYRQELLDFLEGKQH